MAILESNTDLDVKGRILATTVPNSTGSIVTWNSATNVLGLRTNAQIISDLGLQGGLTNGLHTLLNGNKIDVAFDVNTYVKDKSNNNRLLFGNTMQTDVVIKGAVAYGDFRVKDSTDADLFKISGTNKVPYFPQLPAPQTGANNSLAIFDSGNGLWKSNLTIGDLVTTSVLGNYYTKTESNTNFHKVAPMVTGDSNNVLSNSSSTMYYLGLANNPWGASQDVIGAISNFGGKDYGYDIASAPFYNSNNPQVFVRTYASAVAGGWKRILTVADITGLSTNYITTNTNQTGLSGNKTTSGIFNFDGTNTSPITLKRNQLANLSIRFNDSNNDGFNLGLLSKDMFSINSSGNLGGVDWWMRVNNLGDIIAKNRIISSRLGYFGAYNAAQTQGIWSVGNAYTVNASTTTLGNQYGLAYSYIDVGGSSVADQHQIHFVSNGIANVSINLSNGLIRSSGGFIKVGQDNTQMLLAGGGHRPVSDFALASSIITPNNGLLTISTSADLTGGGTFSANQATASNVSIGLSASTLASLALANTAVQPSALSGYVPTSRTLTINGTTFDLSANRTWNIPIPAQVNITQGAGITVTGTYPNITITNSAPNATHTGDVTGATALTIATNAVTNLKMAQMPTMTIKGNASVGTANPVDLTASQVLTMLGVQAGANNYTHPNHSGDVTSVGDGATTIVANAVTFPKIQNIATATFLGRATTGTGNVEALTVAQMQTLLGFSTQTLSNSTSNLIVSNTVQRAALTGDVTATQNSNVTTIANSAVTNAKMANMAANTFKGRLSTAGAPQDLTVAQMQTALGVTTPNNGTFTVQGTGALTGTGSTSANASANTSATLDLTTATKNDITLGKDANAQIQSLFSSVDRYYKLFDMTGGGTVDPSEQVITQIFTRNGTQTINIDVHFLEGADLKIYGAAGGITTVNITAVDVVGSSLTTFNLEGDGRSFHWSNDTESWVEYFN